ncbi:hypothetical protein [uncultured Agrococcus sp.]|uniref:hypothetical protein n=1 Tax=uncultured Agrococcus sp. TaxID=382258 RepID=UPI0025F14EC9|nr:hypothetical protein [uncultured Agrococcus sp.]
MTDKTARPKRFGALKLGFAAVAATALTFGAVNPAFAADYNVGPDDIIGWENGDEGSPDYNYDQWHVGNVDTPGTAVDASLEFGECSVTTLAPVERTVTQVLRGFPIAERPTADPDASVEDNFRSVLESIEIDVAEGSVTLQIPYFAYFDGETDEQPFFTTLRNTEGFGPGVHTLADVVMIDSSGYFPEDGHTLDEILEFLQSDIDVWGDVIELLGIGFTGSEGAVINSISFNGDTHYFGTGDCAPDSGDEDEDDEDEDVEEDDEDEEPTPPRKPDQVDTGR